MQTFPILKMVSFEQVPRSCTVNGLKGMTVVSIPTAKELSTKAVVIYIPHRSRCKVISLLYSHSVAIFISFKKCSFYRQNISPGSNL